MQEQARTQMGRLALPAIVVALAAMLCLMMGAGSAYADEVGDSISKLKGTKTFVLSGDKNDDWLIYMAPQGKLSDVKSSNKKVVRAYNVCFA